MLHLLSRRDRWLRGVYTSPSGRAFPLLTNYLPVDTASLLAEPKLTIGSLVVDVGPGKEASDAKIRGTPKPTRQPQILKLIAEHLKLYTKNAQCEMIVLGASHDNGYANVLSS